MERKIQHHILKGFGGRTFAYDVNGAASDHALARRVVITGAALIALDEKLASFKADETRETRMNGIAGPHGALQVELARTKAAIVREQRSLQADEAKLYLPGPAGDPAMDAELRDWFRALPVERRSQLQAEMGNGGHRALLEAWARLPVPDPAAEHARGLYRNAVEKANPVSVQAFEARHEAIAWAESVSATIVDVLDHGAQTGIIGPSVLVEA